MLSFFRCCSHFICLCTMFGRIPRQLLALSTGGWFPYTPRPARVSDPRSRFFLSVGYELRVGLIFARTCERSSLITRETLASTGVCEGRSMRDTYVHTLNRPSVKGHGRPERGEPLDFFELKYDVSFTCVMCTPFQCLQICTAQHACVSRFELRARHAP